MPTLSSRRARRLALLAYLLAAGGAVVAMVVRPVAEAGDSWEYLLTLQSLWEHGTPDLRDGDFAAALALFPEGHRDGSPGFVPGTPPGWVMSRFGLPYTIHFCTMPLCAVPAKAVLRRLGGSELAAVPVTNVVWLLTAVGLALFAGPAPLRRRLLFVGLAGVSPVIWYLEYGGVEVFCWSLAVIGLVAFDGRRFVRSAVAFGLAATHNPPLAAFVLLPILGALATSWKRAVAVAVVGGAVTAIPVAFTLWHFGEPSLLAPYADPSKISWGRTLNMLTDLNQGLLPFVPVLLIAVPLGVIAAVRRGDWWWLPAVAAVTAMAVTMQMQVNWNSDGRGMLRYLVWMIPPLAWVAARGPTGWLAWAALGGAAVIHGGVLAFDAPPREQYGEHRRLARWVLTEHPTWYDPDPEIFVERQSGPEVVGSVSPRLPVLFGRPDGEVTKVLLDRHGLDRLAGKFERIDPDVLAAMRGAAADTPTYFHPKAGTAWAKPGTIDGPKPAR